jgi:hypothetical protein
VWSPKYKLIFFLLRVISFIPKNRNIDDNMMIT